VTSFFVNQWFGIALSLNCEFEKALFYMQRAVDISIAGKNLGSIAATKGNLARYCHFYPGRIALGFQTTAEALRAAEESGDITSKAYVHSSHGIFSFGMGLLEVAKNHLLKGIEFCERINEKAWNMNAHLCLGETYFEIGDFLKAKNYYEKGALLLEQSHLMPSFVGCAKIGVAISRVMNNEKDVDLESLYAYSRKNKIKVVEGWISKYIGEILLNMDDQHIFEAEDWIQRAIEADQRNGTRWYLGRDYALYAELFKRRGDRFKARENLGRAIEILKECGADGWVGRYEKELALIS